MLRVKSYSLHPSPGPTHTHTHPPQSPEMTKYCTNKQAKATGQGFMFSLKVCLVQINI